MPDKLGGLLRWSYSISERRATDVIYLDLCRVFDFVPCDVLAAKMERNGFGRQTVCTQRVVVNSSMWHSSGTGAGTSVMKHLSR